MLPVCHGVTPNPPSDQLPTSTAPQGRFAYEFVNSRGRVICTPWDHVRARPPCRTSGAVPDAHALLADHDGERTRLFTLGGQGIHRRLEMLHGVETALEWLAQGVLECGAQSLPQRWRQVVDEHIQDGHRLLQ